MGLEACFQGWGVGLGRTAGRSEVRAMERETRGMEREKARRDNIVKFGDGLNPDDGRIGKGVEEKKMEASAMMLMPSPGLLRFRLQRCRSAVYSLVEGAMYTYQW